MELLQKYKRKSLGFFSNRATAIKTNSSILMANKKTRMKGFLVRVTIFFLLLVLKFSLHCILNYFPSKWNILKENKKVLYRNATLQEFATQILSSYQLNNHSKSRISFFFLDFKRSRGYVCWCKLFVNTQAKTNSYLPNKFQFKITMLYAKYIHTFVFFQCCDRITFTYKIWCNLKTK